MQGIPKLVALRKNDRFDLPDHGVIGNTDSLLISMLFINIFQITQEIFSCYANNLLSLWSIEKFEKKSFCYLYWYILKKRHRVIALFIKRDKYDFFSIKFSYLILSLTIDFFFITFFFLVAFISLN